MDLAAVPGTLLQPARRVAIRIGIDQRGRGSAKRKVTRQVGCQRGLTTTALGVQNDDLLQIVSIWSNDHFPIGACPSPWQIIIRMVGGN